VNDAFGSPQSVLVLGGSSDIAQAILRLLVSRRTRRVVLAGRDAAHLERHAEELRALGASQVETRGFEATDTDSHAGLLDQVFDGGDVDLVLVAFGLLGNPATDWQDAAAAVQVAAVNYLGAVSVAVGAAARLRRQGHGVLVGLSSVAGERVRADNVVYGSAKAGMDALLQGLGDALTGSGVRVLIVRPGFVRTRMTAGAPPAPFATTAAAVAEAVVQGLESQAQVVYVPPLLREVMAALRHLPRPLFRRVSQAARR
jgi:decaprenylphospho-beta-D-erythro-pentofuranosid-2-ulose 2-reductase